eukprot:5460732-Amphidinium_carterae.1
MKARAVKRGNASCTTNPQDTAGLKVEGTIWHGEATFLALKAAFLSHRPCTSASRPVWLPHEA